MHLSNIDLTYDNNKKKNISKKAENETKLSIVG